MAELPAVFLHCPELERHRYPEHSPFRTERAARTRALAASMGLLTGPDCVERAPVPATREDLLRLHAAGYLDALQRAGRGEFEAAFLGMGLGTDDCPIFPGLLEHATWAVGASLTGARLLLEGEARVAFNPSGGFHHAGADFASGFCYLNDVALACHLLAEAGRRVLYLDVDVHHGDGVQAFFYERPDVLTMSLHESGASLFPGTGFEDEIGAGAGRGYALNLPLPVGTYDEIYLEAFREVCLPVARAFRPEAVVLELGMDALAGDPLAHLSLTNNAYAAVIEEVLAFGAPVLATGGGGYHVENTARGWALGWSVLSGQDDPADDPAVGLGGVFLQSSEWRGGLRDRALLSHGGQRTTVDEAVRLSVARLKDLLFPLHGIRA
jgi:acetoin utilization protein AcuC